MDNQQTPVEEQYEYPAENTTFQAPVRSPRRRLFAVLIMLLLVAAVVLYVANSYLRIRYVEVDGIQRVPEREVVELAGIDRRSTYFTLHEKKIAAGIEKNRYLAYVGMEKVWPNGVRLFVQERVPIANVVYMGVQYVLAQDGMVLETTGSLSLDNGCVTVSGLSIRDIRVAERIVCADSRQLEVLGELLQELLLQQVLDEASELNIAALDSIFVVTRDGYTANIGDQTELRAKIGTVRAVVDELRRRNLRGGLIEATVPGQASYRPVQ